MLNVVFSLIFAAGFETGLGFVPLWLLLDACILMRNTAYIMREIPKEQLSHFKI